MAQLSWPFDPSTISEGYGNSSWRVSGNNPSGLHDGIDFAIGAGTELRAAASGVVYNNDAGGDGAGVDITTDDGWKVRMWHVSKFLVPNGSYVNVGDVVALSGGTPGTWGAGFTTGAHMHFGVKVNGAWIDPAALINGYVPSTPSADGSVADLAAAVLRGEFGNGPARQAALGARFDEVQAEVNRILGGGAPAPAPAPVANDVVQSGDGYWHIAQRNWGGDNATIEANMNKLIELNGGKRLYAGDTVILEAPAPAPVAEPVPVVEPVAEEVKVETPALVVIEPAVPVVVPAPKKKAKKLTKAEIAKQNEMLTGLPAVDLGVIITSPKNRKIAYAVYMLIALLVGNAGIGFAAAGVDWPIWLVVAVAVTNNLAVPFAALAIANAKSK